MFAVRLAGLADTLSRRLRDGISIERRELSTQLLTLSKCMDHSVASRQVPESQRVLLAHIKQFASFRYDEMLRPSIMVLMLSVKSACLAGWFRPPDVEELMAILKSLADWFLVNEQCWKPPARLPILAGTDPRDQSEYESFISMICLRYFPRLTLKSINLALTTDVAYEVRGCDFQVASQLQPNTKLKLFVCNKEGVETSRCLVHPANLSFLVNGRGVEKRAYTPIGADNGAQMPTDITTMLRLGGNYLQVIGDSTGNYVVAIAIMGIVQWSAQHVQLDDYAAKTPLAEADDEVIVGQSRITLRCPISHMRILTPVKGKDCRHQQAFDYDSYMEINSKRPSWRCPCCNTYVNCSELRHDRQMEEILAQVDAIVFDVLIDDDGSWTPIASPADELDSVVDVDPLSQSQDVGTGAGKLEDLVIFLSDDEGDDNGGIGTSDDSALISPRTPSLNDVTSNSAPPDAGDVEMDDIKPDPMSAHFTETANSSSDSPNALVQNDVNAAAYLSSPTVNSYQAAGTVTSPAADQTQAQILSGESPALWSSPMVGDFVPPTTQPGEQTSPLEDIPVVSDAYPQTSRSTVIQALPALSHFPSQNTRARPSQGSSPVNSVVPGTGGSGGGGHLPLPLEHEVQSLFRQIQDMDMDMVDYRRMQELRQQQGYQATEDINNPRVSAQEYAYRMAALQQNLGLSASAATGGQFGHHYAGHDQQNSDQLAAEAAQHAADTAQGTPVSTPVQSHQYWQRHRTPLQQQTRRSSQGTGASSNTRGNSPSGGGSGGSATWTAGSPGSVQQGGGSSSQVGTASHPTHAGTGASSPVLNNSNTSSATEGWPSAQTSTPTPTWRSAGAPRMRGAIPGGSTSAMGPGGMRGPLGIMSTVGGGSANTVGQGGIRGSQGTSATVMAQQQQPGPVNRARTTIQNSSVGLSPATLSQGTITNPATTLPPWVSRVSSSTGGTGSAGGSGASMAAADHLFVAPEPGGGLPTMLQDGSWISDVQDLLWLDQLMPGSPS